MAVAFGKGLLCNFSSQSVRSGMAQGLAETGLMVMGVGGRVGVVFLCQSLRCQGRMDIGEGLEAVAELLELLAPLTGLYSGDIKR